MARQRRGRGGAVASLLPTEPTAAFVAGLLVAFGCALLVAVALLGGVVVGLLALVAALMLAVAATEVT